MRWGGSTGNYDCSRLPASQLAQYHRYSIDSVKLCVCKTVNRDIQPHLFGDRFIRRESVYS